MAERPGLVSAKVFAVAARDFKHTVLTKAFLFGVIVVPLLIGGLIPLIPLLTSFEPAPLEGKIALVDPDAAVLDAVATQFSPPKASGDRGRPDVEAIQDAATTLVAGELRIDVESIEAADPDTLRERIRAGEYLAIATIPADLIDPVKVQQEDENPHFELLTDEELDPKQVGRIESRIGQAVVNVRVANADLDVEGVRKLTKRPKARTVKLLEDGTERTDSELERVLQEVGLPMGFMMLLWIAAFTGAQSLLMSTIEEKSSKVIEVLLSAVSPMQLMTGKIVGQGAVGLLMLAMYAGAGIAAMIAFAVFDLVEIWQLVLLFLYFFMAYFMVAALMAGVGSAVNDIREANNLLTPVMLIMFVPLMLWLPISQSPNGALAIGCSFVPPAIPFVMVMRIASPESVPFWQIAVSLVWGFATTLGLIWLSARIFRVGVLMQGKAPTPIEMIKWIRYS